MSGPNWLLSACTGHLRTAGKSGESVPDRRAGHSWTNGQSCLDTSAFISPVKALVCVCVCVCVCVWTGCVHACV